MTLRPDALPARYRVILSDIWGVVHDGVAAYPGAAERLRGWRAEGRRVVLLTNAPRPSAPVRGQLARLDVGGDCYDAVVSSGDAGIAYVREHHAGAALGFIGSAADREALEEVGVRLSDGADVPALICMGYGEEDRDAGAHDDALAAIRRRDVPLLCFNPDRVVVHGGELRLCAGTMADRYAAMGGRVVYFGKPHRPIYDRALAAAGGGAAVAPGEVLAIGDAVATDLLGAARYGIDFLFVSGGIEAERIASIGIDALLREAAAEAGLAGFAPVAVVPGLG